MNKFPPNRVIANPASLLFITVLFGCLNCLPASAQTSVAGQPAAAPLNLDTDNVAKQISEEKPSADVKPDTLSSTQDTFEQSMLNAQNRKKVSGFVQGGVGVGTIPAQPGFKSETVNCENTAVGINDAVNNNTQIGIYADASTCRTR